MADEIVKMLDAQGRAFEEFKAANEARLSKIEKGATGAEDLDKMRRAFEDVQAIKSTIETLEAKANRPGVGKTEAERVDDEHKSAFGKFIRKGIDTGLPELEAKAYASSTNSGADGGYAVPKVIDAMIEAVAVNISPIRRIATVQQIGTSDFNKLVNLRGTASGWVGETDARTATATSQLKNIKPTMGELYANAAATQVMLDDVFFNAESWIADEIGTEFARAEGAAFITGDGANKPTGFLHGSTAATADSSRAFGTIEHVPTGVSGDWAATNPTDTLISIISKMKAAYRDGSVWVMPKAQLFEIAAFKDLYGRYVFTPSTAPGVPQTILGYEVVEAEDMPAKAASSLSVAFGNFKRGYLIVDRIGTRMLRDPFSNKPYVQFYCTKRLGGALVNSETIKAIKFAAA